MGDPCRCYAFERAQDMKLCRAKDRSTFDRGNHATFSVFHAGRDLCENYVACDKWCIAFLDLTKCSKLWSLNASEFFINCRHRNKIDDRIVAKAIGGRARINL